MTALKSPQRNDKSKQFLKRRKIISSSDEEFLPNETKVTSTTTKSTKASTHTLDSWILSAKKNNNPIVKNNAKHATKKNQDLTHSSSAIAEPCFDAIKKPRLASAFFKQIDSDEEISIQDIPLSEKREASTTITEGITDFNASVGKSRKRKSKDTPFEAQRATVKSGLEDDVKVDVKVLRSSPRKSSDKTILDNELKTIKNKTQKSSSMENSVVQTNFEVQKAEFSDENVSTVPKQINPDKKRISRESNSSLPISKNQKSFLTVEPCSLDKNLPLNGKRLVFTGLFEDYDRDAIAEKTKELGGTITSAVSGKTDFLVHGEKLEDGRPYFEGSKYQKLIQLRETKGQSAAPELLSEKQFIEQYVSKLPPKQEIPSTVSDTPVPTSSLVNASANSTLWSEKYRPQCIDDLIIHGDIVNKCLTWLRDWQSVCLQNKKKELPKSFRGIPENVNARACLLSGPPGIGKTTAVRLIAKECGYELIEFNASDDRNKNSIEGLAQMSSGGLTLKGFSLRKTCLAFDEIDGLSAGDRGGSQAIIKLISQTKCPVFCICNDRMSTKVRSIANKCYDLRFTRPNKIRIAKRIQQILLKERIECEINSIQEICESVGNDIRQILNHLQLMSLTNTSIRFEDVNSELKKGVKDKQVMLGAFDIAKQFLCHTEINRLTMGQRLDLFFVDHDLIPLLIQDNYLNSIDKSTALNNSPINSWKLICDATVDIANSDVISTQIRTNQSWQLLPDFAISSSISPSLKCARLNSFLPRSDFPRWFGRNSTINKNKRILLELSMYFRSYSTLSCSTLKTSGYLDYLHRKCVEPLKNYKDQKLATEKSMTLMDEYNLSKEAVFENIDLLKLKKEEKLYDSVDSKTKAAFTRAYNSTSHQFKIAPGLLKIATKQAPIAETLKNEGEDAKITKNGNSSEEEESSSDQEIKGFLMKKIAKKDISTKKRRQSNVNQPSKPKKLKGNK